MFELAAFRKANPTRGISLLPLFLMGLVALCCLWQWSFCMGILVLGHVTTASGETASPGESGWLWILAGVPFPSFDSPGPRLPQEVPREASAFGGHAVF